MVARLRALPPALPSMEATGPPVALIVGNGEISLLCPEEVLLPCRDLAEHVSPGWRALSLDTVIPLDTIGVLASISQALAAVGVPVMAFSSHDTDHLLVPASGLGRALAALSQATSRLSLPSPSSPAV